MMIIYFVKGINLPIFAQNLHLDVLCGARKQPAL